MLGLESKNQMSIECLVQDLEKKKDSLMAAFRSLSLKVKDSIKTGSEPRRNRRIQTKLFFYEHMAKFLHGNYQPKTVIDTEVCLCF